MLRQCASLPGLKNNNNDDNVIRDSCQTVKGPLSIFENNSLLLMHMSICGIQLHSQKTPFLLSQFSHGPFRLVTQPPDIFISVYMEKAMVPEG